MIVDRSASMQAVDAAPNRLEAAKQAAINLIDQLPDGGRATVIAAGGPMEAPVAATTDRRQLRDAINGIAARNGGGSDLAQALTLAAALSRARPIARWRSSRWQCQLPTRDQMPATVRYFPIGQRRENVAISAVALQPSAAGQTLFAQATNYGPSAAYSPHGYLPGRHAVQRLQL